MSDHKNNTGARTKLALTRKKNAARRRATQRKTPLGRLSTDGAFSRQNIRRRLQWLAHERQIPPGELPEVKRTFTEELRDFVEKHNVSCDWLLIGDLKGLQRMVAFRGAQRIRTSTNLEADA
jgi:hypothetical protein